MDFSKAANFGSWFSDDSDLTGTQAGGDDPSTTDVSDSNNSIPEKQDDADIEEHVHSELCDQFGCKPYKIELLDRQLTNNSPGSGRRTAVIETLRGMGVKVFVIDAKNTQSTADVVQHIRRVVGFVARENCVQQNGGPLGFQRCLFYQDDQGRLFNLMLSKHVTGPSGTWSQYLETFSGREAMIALTVLCRSLPCIWNGTWPMRSSNTITTTNLSLTSIASILPKRRRNGPELATGVSLIDPWFGVDRGDQSQLVKRQHVDSCDAQCFGACVDLTRWERRTSKDYHSLLGIGRRNQGHSTKHSHLHWNYRCTGCIAGQPWS